MSANERENTVKNIYSICFLYLGFAFVGLAIAGLEGIAPITEYASNGLGYLGTALLVFGLVKFWKG